MKMKFKIGLVILGIVIGFIIGSGTGYYLGITEPELTTPSNNLTPSITPEPTPVDKPSSVKGWRTYENKKYGYSIDFPDAWYNLPNFGVADTHKYFSNQNVGAPLEMTQDGIWVTLEISNETDFHSRLFNSPPGPVMGEYESYLVTKLSDLNIDGYEAVKYLSETRPGAATENAHSVNYAIKQKDRVLETIFLSFFKSVSDKNASIFDQMANSLKFQR